MNKEDNIAAEKQQANDNRTRKCREDLLQFQLCAHMCKCAPDVCKWLHHHVCPEATCKGLIYPFTQCTSAVCKALRLQKKKDDAEMKKVQQATDLASFMACEAQHTLHGKHQLTCPCNAAAREDIEVAPVSICQWEGFSLCANPSCGVLQLPLAVCKKRACVQYRKAHNIVPPRKPKQARTAKRKVTSAKQYSDSSSDEDSSPDVTPRKKIPRKASARAVPVKPALSESDESEVGSPPQLEMEEVSSPALSEKSPPKKLTRSATLTLEGEFIVSKILKGPRKKDKKYLVSWEGYGSEGNTWEPRANLPDDCFPNESDVNDSDESGDDRPLFREVVRSSVVREAEIEKWYPSATHRISSSPPPDNGEPYLILPSHLRQAPPLPKRTPRIIPVPAKPRNLQGRKTGLQADARDLLDPTLVIKGRLRQRK